MTFSIIGFEPELEMIGIAAASKWTGLGGCLPYFRHSVGLVAVQNCSYAQTAYHVLDAMENGQDPSAAIQTALAQDSKPEIRQVLACSLKGEMANYSGNSCSKPHLDKQGKNCIAAGNTLACPEVVTDMIRSFETSNAQSLTMKLLEALEAGQAAGGDERGEEAAVIKAYSLHYPKQRFYPIDLRVDSHDQPLAELRRLIEVFNAKERRVHF